MRLPLLPVTAVVTLALATASIVRSQPRHSRTDPPLDPPRAAFENRIAAVGLVEPASEIIAIASHLPGVVDKVFVEVGQTVRAGEPLLQLDTRALQAALAERRAHLALQEAAIPTAQARLRKSRAALEEARRHLRFAESVSDPRSISAEELTRRRSAVDMAEADLDGSLAELAASEAAVAAAHAALRTVQTDLDRSTITAPRNARVLQVRIRPGEYAPTGPSASPWLLLGDTTTLHVRVDIDEHEAWRLHPDATAVAQVRGNASLQAPATLVRLEPLVVPKQSLTGASTERVDTRVLQAVYRLDPGNLPLYVGQQMDVFIQADDIMLSSARP